MEGLAGSGAPRWVLGGGLRHALTHTLRVPLSPCFGCARWSSQVHCGADTPAPGPPPNVTGLGQTARVLPLHDGAPPSATPCPAPHPGHGPALPSLRPLRPLHPLGSDAGPGCVGKEGGERPRSEITQPHQAKLLGCGKRTRVPGGERRVWLGQRREGHFWKAHSTLLLCLGLSELGAPSLVA